MATKSWKSGAPEISYRADIDGLRAVAVLSVIAFHANPSLAPGGFVGVDIFFVISGFLISSLIVHGLKDGSFSFLEFYGRRVRRLFPALSIVLLTTLVLGWLALPPVDYAALGKNMLAGAAFAANIETYSEVGYFDAPAATKPLLHLWSLGVEEQFYFVFPTLLLLAWRNKAMLASLALLGVLSFALNVALVHPYPAFTFYLPLTRFWEFVAGALLAPGIAMLAATDKPHIFALWAPERRNVFAGAGAALIVAGVMITSEEAFPGWWGLPPVLGTFLLIGAGPQAWINREILAKPILVFVGLISYPLYLWHWPLLVIGRTVMADYQNQHTRTTTAAAIVLTFALSWLTYRFIERPIRARKPVLAARRTVIGCALGLAAVACLALAVVLDDGVFSRYPAEARPLLTEVPFTYFPLEEESNVSGGPLVVIYGDSHAEQLAAGLRSLQNERAFRLLMMLWGSCSPMAYPVPRADGDAETCRKLTAHNQMLFEKLKPDTVIVAALWRAYLHIDKVGETLRFLQKIGVRHIVVVGQVPTWPRPPQQLLYRAYKDDPSHKIPDRLSGFETDREDIDRQLKTVATELGVTFVSPRDVLCDAHGCLARLGSSANDLVQIDHTHLSAAGSRYLIDHVASQLFE